MTTLTNERLVEIIERRSPSLRWEEAPAMATELLSLRAQLAELHNQEPFAWARHLIRIKDGGIESYRITQTKAENSEGLLYRNEIEPLYKRPAQPAASQPSYRDGIEAAAKWIDTQRESFDNEHGRHDPDTGEFEFGNDTQRDHSWQLVELAEGIRALQPVASQPSGLTEGDFLVRAAAEKYLEACESQPLHGSGYFDKVIRPLMEQFRNRANAWYVLELLKRLENTPPASQPYTVPEDDNDLCRFAENFGADIEWANEPSEFYHIIKFTPPQFRAAMLHHLTLTNEGDIHSEEVSGMVPDERAAFNAWNNEDNLPIAGVAAKNAAWLAWQARAAMLQLSVDAVNAAKVARATPEAQASGKAALLEACKSGKFQLEAPKDDYPETLPDENKITQHFDAIALETAQMILFDVNRREDFLGGDIQLLSRIQCRIDSACRAAMLLSGTSAKAEYPELLPCDVFLAPGMKIGKGCRTSALLLALNRRSVYEADLAAMSDEDKASMTMAIEDFKKLISADANSPVLPDGSVPEALRIAINKLFDNDGWRKCYSAIACYDAHEEIERVLAAAPRKGE